jgi:hypothetical protein
MPVILFATMTTCAENDQRQFYFQMEVNNMWETVKTILLLLVGAGISIVSVWIEGKRAREWALEDKKRDRAIAAREIRLREGEEKIKEFSSEIYYDARVIRVLLNAKNNQQLQTVNDLLAGFTKTIDEMDKGKSVYEASVKSLKDDQLTKAFETIFTSFWAYKNFYLHLVELFEIDGITTVQKEKEEHVKTELALRLSYLASIEEFECRINELRSQ